MTTVRAVGILALSAAPAFTTGCPQPSDTTHPSVQEFNLPTDLTATRISGGQEIVYAVAGQADRTYDFFLAKPGEAPGDHRLIAGMPAGDFGFTPTQQLLLPQTISFSDNLQRGVVGFANGSSLLNASDSNQTQAQLIEAFVVTPILAFGEPVLNPTIAPAGDVFAFQTPAGEIAYYDAAGFITGTVHPVLLGPGVQPLFGYDGALGYANQIYTRYYVNNVGLGTVDTYDIAGFAPFSYPNAFSVFEAGLSPLGVDRIGTYAGTSSLHT